MDKVVELKFATDGLVVEYEVDSLANLDSSKDKLRNKIAEGTAHVDKSLSVLQGELNEANADIERLTSNADAGDYATAATSGVITAILDAAFVGEWNFVNAKKDTYTDVNSKVIAFANKNPDYIAFCNTTLENLKKVPPKPPNPRRKPKPPDRLETAIEYLEYKFPLPGDGNYRDGKFGIGGDTHRLDDLCHHPTLVGLICCIIVQFTKTSKYVNKYGEDINIPVKINDYGKFEGNNAVTKMFSGVINWFINCAGAAINRNGHLMSDIATSASLPGSFLSMITELASIPCFRDENFLKKLRDAYRKGIGTGKGQIDLGVFNALFEGAQSKLDVTTEMAVTHELKRQAMPVVINEVLVRGSYFIRRLISELREKNDVTNINWKNVIPFNNRTIVRMMTVATGTFTAVDMADAAVHAATKSADVSTFFTNMILRVNFVGVGRFAVAVASDVGMGVSREVKRSQRIKLQEEQILLLQAKVYYKQAEVWMAVESSAEALDELYEVMRESAKALAEAQQETSASLDNIGKMVPDIRRKNPGLTEDIIRFLKYGGCVRGRCLNER